MYIIPIEIAKSCPIARVQSRLDVGVNALDCHCNTFVEKYVSPMIDFIYFS